ncbi:MAG: response regulator receiver protein [Pseudonocardiales bacterium]|nr:response regulator receiver protein [Pseudonocardiales bacterium]
MIDIQLFGHPSVSAADQQLMAKDFEGIKPRHVLLLLATNLGRYPLSKERMADSLWQGNPPASWVSTLEGYVSVLRRGLARLHPGEPSAVLTRERGYMLDPSRVRVDLHRFDAMLAEGGAARGAAQRLTALTSALQVAGGEVMAGERNVAWVLEVRERYQLRVCRAAVEAGRLALQSGDISTAARHGQSARDLNPLDEQGWQLVIETQWLDGHRSDALRSFNTVRSLLERELGIAPCSALQQLYVQVLYDEPLAQSA